MTHERLEHRLRSEPMPDEARFTPRPLPATVADAQAVLGHANRGTSWFTGVVMTAAAAAVITLIAVVSFSVVPGREPGGGSTPTGPTDSPSPTSAQSTTCTPEDLDIRAEPWGGAAGSRGTVLIVGLAAGHEPCRLVGNAGARIEDATGAVVIRSAPTGDAALRVAGARVARVTVQWSNWCDGTVQGPVSLVLEYGTVSFPIQSPGGADPVPPCLGDEPSHLFVTEERPAS